MELCCSFAKFAILQTTFLNSSSLDAVASFELHPSSSSSAPLPVQLFTKFFHSSLLLSSVTSSSGNGSIPYSWNSCSGLSKRKAPGRKTVNLEEEDLFCYPITEYQAGLDIPEVLQSHYLLAEFVLLGKSQDFDQIVSPVRGVVLGTHQFFPLTRKSYKLQGHNTLIVIFVA